LRQNALIVVLAQMGCFVPASKAHIGIVDKLFSRVGAADDLAKGHSTFMIEMIETATILNQATDKSLVILDEIGRGTATFDGLSIAWACLENLHNTNKCRSLFATHYHELTSLTEQLKNMSCHTMQVKEWNNDIIFMHTVTDGAADRSYGIHVAKLAGLPENVINRATQILHQLENNKSHQAKITIAAELPLFQTPAKPSKKNPALDTLSNLNPDNLSPKEALDMIYQLKKLSAEN
jgi:DNA mismatch repair protein MutS